MTSGAHKPDLDRKRLARLCEMFRSDNEHERATAARLATSMLQACGTTWTQVLSPAQTRTNASQSQAQSSWNSRTSHANYSGSWERHERELYRTWDNVELKALLEKLFSVRHRLSEFDHITLRSYESCIERGVTGKQWEQLEGIGRKAKVWMALGGSRAKPTGRRRTRR